MTKIKKRIDIHANLSDFRCKQSVIWLCHRFHSDAAAQRGSKGHIGLISEFAVGEEYKQMSSQQYSLYDRNLDF